MKHRFIYGLKPHIKSQVYMLSPLHLNEAMQHALAVDDIIYSNTERRFNPRPEQYWNNNVRRPVQQ